MPGSRATPPPAHATAGCAQKLPRRGRALLRHDRGRTRADGMLPYASCGQREPRPWEPFTPLFRKFVGPGRGGARLRPSSETADAADAVGRGERRPVQVLWLVRRKWSRHAAPVLHPSAAVLPCRRAVRLALRGYEPLVGVERPTRRLREEAIPTGISWGSPPAGCPEVIHSVVTSSKVRAKCAPLRTEGHIATYDLAHRRSADAVRAVASAAAVSQVRRSPDRAAPDGSRDSRATGASTAAADLGFRLATGRCRAE